MNLAEALTYFRQHVIELNADIYQYKTVFLDAEGNQNAVSKSGGLFFEHYHRIFWNHLALVLSRLTDSRYQGKPKKDGTPPKYENFVIETLMDMAVNAGMECVPTLNPVYLSVKNKLESFREARNKIIAHTDSEWLINNSSIALHLSEAEDAIGGIETIISSLSQELNGTWENLTPSLSDDAYRLLFVVREGLILERLQDKGEKRFYEFSTEFDDIPKIQHPPKQGNPK